jgi:hypothetical protein
MDEENLLHAISESDSENIFKGFSEDLKFLIGCLVFFFFFFGFTKYFVKWFFLEIGEDSSFGTLSIEFHDLAYVCRLVLW